MVRNMACGTGSTAIAFDNPEAYIPRDRRRALAEGRELPDRVQGSALFADISGFTPLTEALVTELGAQRGPEELTATLNRVFHEIIAVLDGFDGDVIYFSGDAITCWIDGDDGIRAAACGLAMQEEMERVGEVVTPGGQKIRLAMKVAVAVGRARRFVVGDPEIQLIDVLAGELIDQLAAAEHLAGQGEVVLEQSALESLEGRIEVSERRVDPESGRTAGVLGRITAPVPETPDVEAHHALPVDLVRPWLLPAVYERLRTGRGEFLAELRPATPVFVRFTGIDYDRDDDAIEKLDEFIRRSQSVFEEHGGHLLQLTLGDKGAYLYGVFGSPQAHEDDAARAAAAALGLLELDGSTAAREIQIGITNGRLRSGTYGHALRRTFVCLGDAVNLAARLMSHAWPGQVLATEEVRSEAGEAFTWEQLDDLTVKGKEEPVATFALTGRSQAASARHVRYELPMVGRKEELAALDAALGRAEEAQGSVVGISADAGVGKSRLVAEFIRGARARGEVVAYGETESFGGRASYGVWQEIWRTLFRIDDAQPEEAQRATLERELAAVDPALVPRAPLLEPVLGISIPDNELTRLLDAEVRKSSLEALLADCLRARAAEEPLVLVLEDCHWIDPLSRDLLRVLARAVGSLRVLIVLAYRPDVEPGGGLGLDQLPHVSELTLSPLGSEEAEELIRAKVTQASTKTQDALPALVELVTARSEGNPFYVEELLNYIGGHGIDLGDTGALAAVELPESLHSLVLSRVDTLPEAPRRTLKVASVVGRSFDVATLVRVYHELGSEAEVGGQLRRLKTLDLVVPDRGDDSYLFKHAVTHEVTYESMPFSFRAMLHERVGADIEATAPDAIDQNLDLLAHHYWLSENIEKKREYLVRAGESAKANYANEAAIDYLERSVQLLETADRWRVTREVGEVREVLGDWPAAESTYREVVALAEEVGDLAAVAWAHTSLADLERKRGEYDDAMRWLETAEQHFEALDDKIGVGRVLQISGTVAATRGDFDTAREKFEASLAIRRELGDAAGAGALLSNLGVMAEYERDYERSEALHREGLALRIEAGDKRATAISHMNLGNVLLLQGRADEARACQEESLRLRRETGDPWGIALGEHNLGILLRSEGDYETTRALFGNALKTFRDHGDKWALAFMLEDIAALAVLLDEPAVALRLGGAGAAVREETGAPRGQADQEELDAQLAPAREALGPRAEALWEAGRLGGLEEAIDTALRLCERR